MAMLDELEAALRARWDRDTLAVYADHLQSLGELRGELIVIDLRIEEAGPKPELVARRKELLAAWLATLPPGQVMHGFLDVDATGANPVEQVRAALASPAAPYIRTVAIVGAPNTIDEAVALLAAAPRPGLARIVLRQWDATRGYTLRKHDTQMLWNATPDLDTLELDGYRLCEDVAHPRLRRIRTCGSDASRALLAGSDARWQALEEIDFAFVNHLGGPIANNDLRTKLFEPEGFPKLHTLDFTRCEPGYADPISLGGKLDIVDIACTVPVLRQLRTWRLPNLPHKSIGKVQDALAAMPRLEQLVVRGPARTFQTTAQVTFI